MDVNGLLPMTGSRDVVEEISDTLVLHITYTLCMQKHETVLITEVKGPPTFLQKTAKYQMERFPFLE